VAYTAGYGAVMPAYTQPMMSAGQVPHSEVANESSVHTDACSEDYVGAIDTDYTAADEYYTADTFVDASDAAVAESAVDVCLNDEDLADRLVR